MILTQKQWEWLAKAPKRIEVNGDYYDFIQTWDDNGDPIVEMIKYGNQHLNEIFSPNRELTQYFKEELHKVWEVWKDRNTAE
jgi:ABC-type ATPase with predicted acetyltransferase domain